jgi:hypothetical protein
MAAPLMAREELADQVDMQKNLRERFQRVNGRPLAAACPARCTCRGGQDSKPLTGEGLDDLDAGPTPAGR